MRILLSGGGTGGHITPILAVAHELKTLKPDCYTIYVGERSGKFARLTEGSPDIDEARRIFAGKFRRYYGEAWWKRLLDVKTNVLNIRDLFYFLIGIIQSWFLLRKLRPDVVFLKGSYVGMPVGIAAHWLHIPIITHDSDSTPGLANRFIGRWARWHATGMPAEFYGYPKDQTRYVGVIVGPEYEAVTAALKASYKAQLNVPEDSQVLLITGGSGGAAKINEAMSTLAPQLLQAMPNLYIIHQTGKGKTGVYKDFVHDRLKVFDLLHPMYVYTGMADVVVSRAGANTIAELGVQGKACVIIPNPLLTGGHQSKNAEHLKQLGAAIVIEETELDKDSSLLETAIHELLADEAKRRDLGSKLQALTKPDAARDLAMLLLETTNQADVQKEKTTPA